MLITKPKLSLEGQIEHLKEKGVLFNIMDEESAKEYLTQHNNYFKLTAYRKNYDKHPDGENKGKYINRRNFSPVCIGEQVHGSKQNVWYKITDIIVIIF